jgi:hypothetical protein
VYLRTGCRGEYLNLSGVRRQETAENCTVRSFVICNHQKFIKISCGMQGKEKKYFTKFGWTV